MVFDDLLNLLQLDPTVDLFASRITRKFDKYVSRYRDPFAWKIDAFSFEWREIVYMFPPICLISHTIQKFLADQVEAGILITPLWPGLPDIPILFGLLTSDPILIPASGLEGTRPTRYEFQLVGWSISSSAAKRREFQETRLARSSKALNRSPLSYTSDTGQNSPIGGRQAGITPLSLYP
jgi:hypothetical protein